MKPFNITTGVHSANDTEWLWDEDNIDLGWEEHIKECKNKYHDNCYLQETGTTLYGDWIKKKGLYHLKHGGEYAAIYNPDYNTIQVVRSRFIINCSYCSPCYPGQGDVDTPGSIWAYCLPPELMREDWVKKNGDRICEYVKTKRSHYWRKWCKIAS